MKIINEDGQMTDYKESKINEEHMTVIDILATAGVGLTFIALIYLEPLFDAFTYLIRSIT